LSRKSGVPFRGLKGNPNWAVTRPWDCFVPTQTGKNRSFEKKHAPQVSTAGDECEVLLSSTSNFSVQRLLYDKQTAAEILSISLRSLNYLLSRGKIRFRRVGSRVLIPHAELVRFAHGHHPEPVAGE
jgi:excisionase family DNA binding protein